MAENRDELKHYMLCLPNFNLKGRIAIALRNGMQILAVKTSRFRCVKFLKNRNIVAAIKFPLKV